MRTIHFLCYLDTSTEYLKKEREDIKKSNPEDEVVDILIRLDGEDYGVSIEELRKVLYVDRVGKSFGSDD